MEIKSIGIIGVGFVGGAVENYFANHSDLEVFIFDKFKERGSIEEVNQADCIFVCVPTPFDMEGGGYDDSAVQDALSNISDDKLVVLKSTILPGSTRKYQEQYPNLNITFNPEFLVQATANEDFIKPDRQIVGYTEKTKGEMADAVLAVLPDAPYKKTMDSTEAEMVKYFGNCFLATKVIFANQILDLCKKLEIDYNTVKDGTVNDHRIGNSHLDVDFDGYRGYGGACFPKDMRALIQLGDELDSPVELLKAAEKINFDLNGGNK